MLTVRSYPVLPIRNNLFSGITELNITSRKSTNIDINIINPKLTKIPLLQPMNTYLKKSLAALYSLYLHLLNIHT